VWHRFRCVLQSSRFAQHTHYQCVGSGRIKECKTNLNTVRRYYNRIGRPGTAGLPRNVGLLAKVTDQIIAGPAHAPTFTLEVACHTRANDIALMAAPLQPEASRNQPPPLRTPEGNSQ
jgi:hypothetical protein